MFEFSQDLGHDILGRWDDSYKFTITVVNDSGCSPPEVHKLKVRVRHEGDCLCDNTLCTSYTCSSQGLFLRDQNNISFYSSSESMPIHGDWGPSSLSIESIYARPFSGDVEHVPGIGVAFSMGDTITITFRKDTNYGRGLRNVLKHIICGLVRHTRQNLVPRAWIMTRSSSSWI